MLVLFIYQCCHCSSVFEVLEHNSLCVTSEQASELQSLSDQTVSAASAVEEQKALVVELQTAVQDLKDNNTGVCGNTIQQRKKNNEMCYWERMCSSIAISATVQEWGLELHQLGYWSLK